MFCISDGLCMWVKVLISVLVVIILCSRLLVIVLVMVCLIGLLIMVCQVVVVLWLLYFIMLWWVCLWVCSGLIRVGYSCVVISWQCWQNVVKLCVFGVVLIVVRCVVCGLLVGLMSRLECLVVVGVGVYEENGCCVNCIGVLRLVMMCDGSKLVRYEQCDSVILILLKVCIDIVVFLVCVSCLSSCI